MKQQMTLVPTFYPQCDCGRQVAMMAHPVVVTGVVEERPAEPDGLHYPQCTRCKRFVRCEIAPPDAAKLALAQIAA